jgi:LPS O-antigen subunit length determinant protein (WzzB/FepE family)
LDDSSPPTVQDIPIGIKTDAAHRQEFDSMGYVTAPADRYWGAQTQRSLQHFSIGDDRTPKAVYQRFDGSLHWARRAQEVLPRPSHRQRMVAEAEGDHPRLRRQPD